MSAGVRDGLNTSFRIHPAVGVARVGNSQEYVIAPETMAGHSADGVGEGPLTGGLPIRAGTLDDPVRSSDLRDEAGALKRQAARFRIYGYVESESEQWPRGQAATIGEVTVGCTIGGRVVEDIIWTVHVANKKANAFVLVEDGDHQGIGGYEEGRLPPIRNASVTKPSAPQPVDKLAELNDPARVKQLTIDPGPRTTQGTSTVAVHFDREGVASYYDDASSEVVTIEDYPKSFPGDGFARLDAPSGPIDTLGEIFTDDAGRLLVAGGYGRAVGWRIDGKAAPLSDDVNNDQWFDDTSDGPVSATIVFADGTRADAGGAWVTTTDPSYAPQILNVVSLWDDVYDVWVREMGLEPEIFDVARGGYQASYKPTFDDQLQPIFKAAALQPWVANMGAGGAGAHEQVGAISSADDPATTVLAGIDPIFRDPNNPDDGLAKMPLHLGDAGEAFLALRKTQYFFLKQWNEGRQAFRTGAADFGPGELLDKATFVNCIGGRFSPGIDLTFVMREPALYVQPWQSSGAGPFRVASAALSYAQLPAGGQPLLSGGYVPRHVERGLEPGDLSKWMALPWHTDYNSCATHPPSPNPEGNRTVFWSWPAQRPVAVYAAADVTWSEQEADFGDHGTKLTAELPEQRWSVRGPGTDSPDAENWGRFQDRMDMLASWQDIGVVMQASAIDGATEPLPQSWYLEAESRLVDTGQTPVEPFPNFASEIDPSNALQIDPRGLFFKLLNLNDHPEVLPDARAYTDAWLKWSEAYSNDPGRSTWDQRFFAYSEDAFQTRLDEIYQELVDTADAADPTTNQVRTYAQAVERIVQLAPFNLVDGAWLRNIGMPGPIDEARSLLFSVSMDELGDGDVSMNHCNIYRDLCHSVGYYPSDIYSSDFAYDPRFLDSAFTVPAFELAISQFTADYYPELLGMTLQLEWSVIDLKPTRDLMEYFGINPHFYVMHIGIDNAVDGHGARAAEAIRLYLRTQSTEGGQAAVDVAWRRIWNGYVAFGSVGTFGEDFQKLLTSPPTTRDSMIEMFSRKAEFGSQNHQDRMVGGTRINEWFSDPEAFLDALLEHQYIIPGNWTGSRMNQLLSFENGPMFRVFTDEEIALWTKYVNELDRPAPPAPVKVPAARAMAAVIDQLRPVQRGIAGHATNMLAGEDGLVRPLAWWFEQPTATLMEALISPNNDIITPGDTANSRFLTELIAPTGPMGEVFGYPASIDPARSCRDVVTDWIVEKCPMLAEEGSILRLNTPLEARLTHPTGKIVGMGTVH